ncbi:hypothetical protein C2I18_29180 [Paenibacillus sp. PK3_47]|uniref:DUF1835 domain-containing protein n=1 Tax=Paenibacillus sp. PK3_47 TaxID=2072642 RepID=UPI00201D441D|nr:DUF1835 domain-containing protein [Paenibacillus sp. PK3_47]UQZ37255.1 hypothetical protein C2I18_29180 [Paenibacillus sp. PK3_47]
MEKLYNSLPQGLRRYVHIVFSLSDAGSLKVTLRKTGKQELCQVLAFDECFSVGPICNLETAAGQQNRLLWLMEFDEHARYGQHLNREHQLDHMIKAVRSIPAKQTVVIWCADNAHDQTGLRFVLHLLREREQPVHIVNVTELFHAAGFQKNDEPAPYFRALINREHFQDIVQKYYSGIPLDPERRRMYESQWLMLSEENHLLRLWEEGTVKGRKEDALDELIIRSVIELEHEQDENGYIKAGSVVVKVFETSRQFVRDTFISYRIWMLINQGMLKFSGLPFALHQFSVKWGRRKLSSPREDLLLPDKLNSLFMELEVIKQTYAGLSADSLDKNEWIEEVIYSIMEMFDGYRSLNFEADIIDKNTGESITENIQLHDKYRDYIEARNHSI